MIASLEWLEDPRVFRVNRLDAHSDHIVYQNEQELQEGKINLRQSLDGCWKFKYSHNSEERPAAFFEENFDDAAFGSIQVPGHIETQGYGQIQYINKLYDWDGHAPLRPPHVDWTYNPIGSYVRSFDLKPELMGKPVVLSFQGAEEAIYVWLNGHFVGYSEDSFTPSEFDITEFVRDKHNRLCVEVYKRSSAAWLEDQDFFSFSGLFRSVYLEAKLPVAIEDVWFKTELNEELTVGKLCVRLKLQGYTGQRITLLLSHPQDGVLIENELTLVERDGYLFSQEFSIENVRLWDFGTPELYQALLRVEDGGLVPYEIGFRHFQIKDKLLILNGKRLMLNGVNRHEWNPETGRCITLEDMQQAMEMFKENNINAVRTCHYPNRSEWYAMCDREGIYMMDETNLETHGSWQKDMTPDPEWNIPASLPEWLDNVLDRANSMFQRDKNHVSILFWSCGNEAYAGTDIAAIADFFREVDPSRVVHYEGVFWCREFDYISDVESRMYATPTEIREYLENNPQKPYLSCEYMHSMGNSLGGMESYIKLGEEFPMYQGGFIWDYKDQALWHENAQGQRVLGYGGDFGDRQSDYAFSANGIVTADGQPKPCMQEVRYWYLQPEERAAFDERNRQARALWQAPKKILHEQPLRFVDGDGAYGLHGDGFKVLFSKLEGGPCSIRIGDEEWLWRAPKLAFWRAPTENDIGCSFPQKSAIWNAVELWQKCCGFRVGENSSEAFEITYAYTAACMSDLEAEISYRIEKSGRLKVSCTYHGKEGCPELPIFGIRFATMKPVKEICWTGLSGETYPDRYKGAVYGTYTEVPHLANYLVPQECGNHYNTDSFTLKIGATELVGAKTAASFSFSALPYTPAQLQDAYHVDELPKSQRTVVTIAGEMRGVGGIDTWMTDVEPAYRISAEKDQSLCFELYL